VQDVQPRRVARSCVGHGARAVGAAVVDDEQVGVRDGGVQPLGDRPTFSRSS
jgi:hypothetical protein